MMNMTVALDDVLSGMAFPASKVQIITYADDHGATKSQMELLQALPTRQYNNMDEITESVPTARRDR